MSRSFAREPIFIRALPRMAIVILSSALGLMNSFDARAENWPGWRGPTGSGYSSESNLPLTWSVKKEGGKTDTLQNVLWKAPLKNATGHSSPIVWEDRVFITTSSKQTGDEEKAKKIPEHQIICFRATDGKQLWTTTIAPGKQDAGYSIYATPTPVTDGKAVYAWFGSAVIAAVDYEGKLLWRHERPAPMELNPGICSSPILYEDTVVLLCDQSHGKGFLQGLSKQTGEIQWEQKRKEQGPTNTTPLVVKIGDKPQLVVAGSELLQGLNPKTGEPIWWLKTPGFGESPVRAGPLIYTSKGGNESAALVDPSGAGDIAKSHVKWRLPKLPGDYASAVVSGEYICFIPGDGVVSCIKLATGEQVFTERLEGVSKLSSPVATADGRVYLIGTGKSYAIKPGAKCEILGKGDLGGGGGLCSSPAISGGRIYIRDFENLWCIGKSN